VIPLFASERRHRNFASVIFADQKGIKLTQVHVETRANVLQSHTGQTMLAGIPKFRTRGFCWSRLLLPTCPCWRQVAQKTNIRVLLTDVNYTAHITLKLVTKLTWLCMLVHHGS